MNVLIVIIPWVSAWYTTFACTVIKLEQRITEQNPEEINTTN